MMNRQNAIQSRNQMKLIVFLVAFMTIGFSLRHSGKILAQSANDSAATWKLSETDCQIPSQYWLLGDSVEEYRSAPKSTRIHFKSGWGTKALVARAIEPAYLISELNPTVWIKATRPKIQLLVRVVLPRTKDPNETGPMTVLLPGPVYTNTDRWQKLEFSDADIPMAKLLEEAAWKLRAKYSAKVDTGEAYVDKVVLNIYTGPGSSTVWIDDLQIDGAVEATVADQVLFDMPHQKTDLPVQIQTVGYAQNETRRPSLAQTNNTVLEVRGQPFFARSIQHNGEPFEVLKEMGFNTIELPNAATVQQMMHARRLDMWVVCPPPDSAGLQPISAEYDRVLAWSLGNNLSGRVLQRAKTTIEEIRHSDFRENRPVIGFVDSGWFEFGRVCDILSGGFEPIGGSFVLSHYSDWIQQRAQMADKSVPIWATIQTETLQSIKNQTVAIAGRVPPLPVEPAQLKFMAYEAIAGGARGMRFTSHDRLDSADPVARLRSLSLRWLNAHLAQLQPWICGGAVVKRTHSANRSQQLTTLSTDRSRLTLIQRTSQYETWVAGATPVSSFKFSDDSLTSSEQAYHLSENGLIPLDQGRVIAGHQMTVENCGPLEAIVITQEPMIINRLSESYAMIGTPSLAQMRLELVQQWLAMAQLINGQLGRLGHSQPRASGQINEANNALRQAQALIERGSAMSANRLLYTADQHLAFARHSVLSSARSQFSSTTSSPLLTHVSLVPIHFDLINKIRPEDWQPNGLAGGDFENLQQMTAQGWENHRANEQNFITHVELTMTAAVDGERALSMSVAPGDTQLESDTLVDRTPLWIKSSKVPVKAGQFVRIHGWVKVPKIISGSHDGLMIIDSIGGSELAERIAVTSGWREFSVYRCPTQDTELQLTMALTGMGQALLDEFSVRVIDLPTPNVRQARNR